MQGKSSIPTCGISAVCIGLKNNWITVSDCWTSEMHWQFNRFWRFSLHPLIHTLGSFHFTIPYQLNEKIQFSEGFSTHLCLSKFMVIPLLPLLEKCYSFLSNCMEGRNTFIKTIIFFCQSQTAESSDSVFV